VSQKYKEDTFNPKDILDMIADTESDQEEILQKFNKKQGKVFGYPKKSADNIAGQNSGRSFLEGGRSDFGSPM